MTSMGRDMQTGQLTFKWDVKNLEIRTRSVEMTLQPLVIQVTTLFSTKGPSNKKKGKSKRAGVLVAAVEKATETFIQKGEVIATENPDIQTEMLAAVENVRQSGQGMSLASREFADDPSRSSPKRAAMIQAGRKLLSAVTRLLILADMVDVHLLLNATKIVQDDLKNLQNVSSQPELMKSMEGYSKNMTEMMQAATRRQQDLKDPQMRDDIAGARALLKKHSTMLLTTSKVYLRHPELAAAASNRNYVLQQICEAVNTISQVAQGRAGPSYHNGQGELAAALNDFDEQIVMDPLGYSESRTRPTLEQQLEMIISSAGLMADSSSTRDERKDRIVMECNAVRQALQDLLSQYMTNTGKKERSQNVELAIDQTHLKTKDLRRQLRKTVCDHISDGFLNTMEPLVALVEAAKEGDQEQVEECANFFAGHASKMIEASILAAKMSNNEDGVKMVNYAVSQIKLLCPQVINAARILAARPKSKVAQENMEVFREAWENQVRILMDAVDDITSIDDYLAVSENHILEDVEKCLGALQDGDGNSFGTAHSIIGRAIRIGSVVTAEMGNYIPGIYTGKVLEAVKFLRDLAMPVFVERVNITEQALASNEGESVDPSEFIDASTLVLDGVREIRRAVLMNRAPEDLDPDEVEVDIHDDVGVQAGEHLVDEYPDITGITNAREAMRKLTEEDKERIAQQVESFRTEKLNFDRQVGKWDDTGNDIIALAKRMCLIMMNMTDFTRGQGPLKTSMDVINAAKSISEVGKKLNVLAGEIAKQCPESSTKQDLLAYLQQIPLFCQQLKITSNVKADVQNVSGQLIVSGGLDSATSLIQAAKNLMNSVVSTVQACFVASTKYPKHGSSKLVWKMKTPEKKPLVLAERLEDVRARVRRGSQKKVQNPLLALSEFQSQEESLENDLQTC